MSPATFRAIRRRLRIKQTEIAADLGVSSAAVCQYEKGKGQRISQENAGKAEAMMMRRAFERMERREK